MNINTVEHNDTLLKALLPMGDKALLLKKDLSITAAYNNNTHTNLPEQWPAHLNQADTPLLRWMKSITQKAFQSATYIAEEKAIEINGTFLFIELKAFIYEEDTTVLLLLKVLENSSVNKWRLALETTGLCMWEFDGNTNTISFTPSIQNILGYEPQEIGPCADWLKKLHPEDLPVFERTVQETVAANKAFYWLEMRIWHKDGYYKWILSKGAILEKDANNKIIKAIGTHTDIDARKKLNLRYLDNLTLLDTLISNFHDGILVNGSDGKILYTNQEYCNIYNIPLSPEQMKGMTLDENIQDRKHSFLNPDAYIERIKEVTEARIPVYNDISELVNGKIYSRDYIPVNFKDGSQGEIWKLRDITEQKQVDKKFEEQRLFYEMILNSMPMDIAVHNPQDLSLLYINPNAIKDPQMREWIIGKTLGDYYTFRNKEPLEGQIRQRHLEKAISTKKLVSFEEHLVSNDGTDKYYIRFIKPILNNDDSIYLILAYGIDITDRKHAEDELRTSRDTFSNAFKHSGIGMALISPKGAWLDVNDTVCKMTGYSREELLDLTLQDITHPDDISIDLDMIHKMLNRELSYYNLEKRYISKTGKTLWVLLSVSLIWNKNGTPKFFLSQLIDITAQKELDEQLKRKNSELEAAKTSLQDKIQQMDELNHIIAHNLRGPAGNIKMVSEILANGKDDEQPIFETHEAIDIIHKSSIALMNSLETLMQAAQIKLNNKIQYDDCNVNTIISNIVNQLHASIIEKHVNLKLNIEVDHIKYPQLYLESIFYNLISNAIKYSTTERQPEIQVRTFTKNDKIIITVRDNGLGIDLNKYQNKVFKLNQVFHTGHDSKGVGLFMTKTQVESLGGNIRVISEPNIGSEFIVTL